MSQRGFTAIELMIVVAVLGVTAAISHPGLDTSRKNANETASAVAMEQFRAAEDIFKAGVGNSSFGAAEELFDTGLIDATLATERWFGYTFALNVSDDGQHYDLTACPAAINRSGNHCFYTDDTSAATTVVCPRGQHLDPLTGKCVPNDPFVTRAIIGTIQSLDALSNGTALPLAKSVAEAYPDVGQQILALMDTNHDALLTFDEALNPDILGPTLRPLLASITTVLRRDMALRVANEQLSGAPIATMSGSLLDFLNLVPPFTAGAAAREPRR